MSNEQEFGLRVKSVHVKKLFGMYDHDIVLKSEERTTIIFGRNGAGKTVMFKLTHALLGADASFIFNLLKYPYEEFRVVFDNNDQLIAKKESSKQLVFALEIGEVESEIRDDQIEESCVDLQYLESGHTSVEKSLQINLGLFLRSAENLQRRLPIHQIAPGQWRHTETSEILDAFQMVERYGSWNDGDNFSINYIKWRKSLKIKQIPQTLLIQAQRLIKVKNLPAKRYGGEERETIKDAVLDYSEDLKIRIDQTLAEYAREAQRLDKTYPQRLFGKPEPAHELLGSEEIQQALTEIKERQDEYQSLGILDDQTQAPDTGKIIGDEVDDSYRVAISLYIQDTKKKLLIVDELAKKIKLLLDSTHHKFSNKELKVSPLTHDLMVRSTIKNDKELKISALSSGEQHQFVLTYDLLFRTKANTLVLIDEPELSLHMEWQERFLSDLKAVINLVHFDVLLATHSPFIVNGHNELSIGLSVKIKGEMK